MTDLQSPIKEPLLSDLRVDGCCVAKSLDFTKTMSASKPQESVEVRIKHSLNKKEKEFVDKRRKDVQQSLQKLQIQCSKAPNIALLGSGGGERAMVGLLGSLVQLQKTGLLDCILYLSGVSGSTWCMASLYQEADWSTKLETVKDKIIKRLSGPKVSWKDTFDKLHKYHKEKDFFSLTDVWATMFITNYVKEIDEHTLTDHWDQLSKDPFPIYTVIDKQSKQHKDADPWFEFTPHEAGYSLTGAFVETSSFGSQFDNGSKIKDQPEIDMLYLQALCGSALADGDEIHKFLWEQIKGFLRHSVPKTQLRVIQDRSEEDPDSPPIGEYYHVLMDLADMNLSVLNGIDPSDLDESIRTKLNELTRGKHFQNKELNLADKEAAKLYMKLYTVDVCNALSRGFSFQQHKHILQSIFECVTEFIWGRNYDFLHNMKDKAVPDALLKSETRDYEDAGLLLNSPYFSVLREERDIDLIISLDFSDGDPFMTVREAAETCKKRKIPFPEVPKFPNELSEKPKDFYVFKGKNAPTVIHIPLFNEVNCGDDLKDWRNRYKTFQLPYNAEMITKLMDVAGKNITNNRAKLLEQIRVAIKAKCIQAMARQNSVILQ